VASSHPCRRDGSSALAGVGGAEAATVRLLREIIAKGRKTARSPWISDRALAEFMEDSSTPWFASGPSTLPALTITERVHNAVEFFLRGAKP